MRSCRSRACSRTAGETPCAENTTIAPSRHLVGVVDEDRAALGRASRRRAGCARSACARRRGRRAARAPARRPRRPGRRPRSSRGAWPAGRACRPVAAAGTASGADMRPGYGRPSAPPASRAPDPGCRAVGPAGDDGAMKPLPLPVRVAAGLVATAVEQARDLPRLVVELPVTAVSQALQASMRVQQKVTELAIKGDRVLGTLRPVEETPSWATFDEDEPPPRNGAEHRHRAAPARPPGLDRSRDDLPPARAERRGRPRRRCAPTSRPPRRRRRGGADDRRSATSPPALPGYAEMTIPQLRGKLRFLSLDELQRAAGVGAGARRPAAVRDHAHATGSPRSREA